jgi:uncharacterized protein (TIGR02147 family)
MGASDIDVFAYLDFRSYLRDYYNARKASARGFSYRSFSRRAGLTSPNYLKLVIDGKRNLSAAMAKRFAEACGLARDDQRYFIDLVAFGQSTSLSDRDQYYARLTGFQRYGQAHRLDLAHAAYYSAWYMPAIRELAARSDFDANPEWIARQLLPKISASDAKRALDTLLELGLLIREADGSIKQQDVLLSTGPETRGLHIASYHRTMMQRAMESIDLMGWTPTSPRTSSRLPWRPVASSSSSPP